MFLLIRHLVSVAAFCGCHLGVDALAADISFDKRITSSIVRVVCKDEDTAKRAGLAVAPLFDNKQLAVSARWDDNNPRHVLMARAMSRAGWKGTFYLNNPENNFKTVISELLANECGVGGHTMTHPPLPTLNPNDMFQECMECRVLLEAVTDKPVLSFVTPGVVMTLWISGETRSSHILGEVLRRCGYLGGPEFTLVPANVYGLDEREWLGGRLVTPGDRETTEDEFSRLFEQAVGKEVMNPTQLPVVIGVHTWQDAKNLKRYKASYQKYAGNDAWWYCDNNDYLAYRYRARHAVIEADKSDGIAREFRLSFIRAREFAKAVPLTLVCSEQVDSVTIDGHEVPVEPDGASFQWNGNAKPVMKIDVADDNGAFTEFPGISARLSVNREADTARLLLHNQTENDLTDLTIVLHVPPMWKMGIHRATFEEMGPDERKEFVFGLGDRNEGQEFFEGQLFFAARIDFETRGQCSRLYAKTRIPQKYTPTDSPRDRALILGPLPETTDTVRFLQEASRLAHELTDYGTLPNERWCKSKVNPRGTPIGVSLTGCCAGWKEQNEKINRKHNDTLLSVLLHVQVAEEGEYRLFSRKDMKFIFLNGLEIAPSHQIAVFLHKGLNKLLVAFPQSVGDWQCLGVARKGTDVRTQFLPTRLIPLTNLRSVRIDDVRQACIQGF